MELDAYFAEVSTTKISDLLTNYPLASDYLANIRLGKINHELTLPEALLDVDEEILEEFGLTRDSVVLHFCSFLSAFSQNTELKSEISSITILGGRDKSGKPESAEITVVPGEIVSIVGPTGSGKSRLLEDIECLAQRDTPTERQILLNGAAPNDERRFATGGKLVAQLSQNMNFVMDLTVREFLEMHAKSRMTADPAGTADRCFACANTLAGEKFTPETKVTQLSGGQSRALMIADTALMSASPIILIDEIENAGIDRREAINLLANHEKIILMSTHDPLLALRADKRIVIKNGGIAKILMTTETERQSLDHIQKMDEILQNLRNHLRKGDTITMEMIPKMEDNHVETL